MVNKGDTTSSGGTHARFPSLTQWTQIIEAGGPSSSPVARDALNQLCEAYWFPVYAFIRRKGNDSHKAKDLTQGFFAHWLETDLIKKANPERGRFRSFLLASLNNFLEDDRRKEKAQKRGGAFSIVSIDESEAEDKYLHLPAHEADSPKVFDRTWAATVIERVTKKLKQKYAARGKHDLHEVLKGCLTSKLSSDSYPKVAAKLGMSKATLEVHLSRYKDAFGQCVRAVIAETVQPAEIDDEIRYLMASWAGYLEGKQGGSTQQSIAAPRR